jgi:hypothetical protein
MQSARRNTRAKMDLKKFDIIKWTRLLSLSTHGPVVHPYEPSNEPQDMVQQCTPVNKVMNL